MMESRLATLVAKLPEREVDAVLVSGAENRCYLSGFSGSAGYGENFGQSLGHGVGLAVHEIPRVSLRSEDPLDVNSVFTVEPGIYLSGWGGVCIEDIVVLGQDGATPLSKASK